MQRPPSRALDQRVGLGCLVVAVVVLAPFAYLAGQSLAPRPPPAVLHIQLVIVKDPVSGEFGYITSAIKVAEGAALEVTIVNYDPSAHPVARAYQYVAGTYGGSIHTVAGSGGLSGSTVQWLPASEVSHTFTLNGSVYPVSIPIPPAIWTDRPSIISFTLHPFWSGTLAWTCECVDMGPMDQPGDAMSGTFEVH